MAIMIEISGRFGKSGCVWTTESCGFVVRGFSFALHVALAAALALALDTAYAAEEHLLGKAPHIPSADIREAVLEPIRAILESPDVEIDLARAKLAIDHMIDPTVDIEATIQQLDRMAGELKARIPFGAGRRETAVAILTYLGQPGPWNDGRPFHYDLDDPFGRNLRNKLLSTYLATRKGNCVSMPELFVILAQRVGLEATLVTAPLHQFAKIRDDDGQTLNIEATSFGTLSDERYRHEYGVSDEAMKNGIYLQPWLSRRENAVVMMDTLMVFYRDQRKHALRIDAAKLALSVYPRYVNAMLHLASTYQSVLEEQFLIRYKSFAEMSVSQTNDFRVLAGMMEHWGGEAEKLGWREKAPEQDAEYERTIQHAKTAHEAKP